MKTNFPTLQSFAMKSIRHLILGQLLPLSFVLLSQQSKAQLSPCYANISWYQDAQNPFLYHFCDASEFATGAFGFGFMWDLGDGSTETDSCFDHVYDTAGMYTICITAHACDPNYGGTSCTDDTCVTIFIGGKGGTLVSTLASAEIYGVHPNPFTQSTFIQYHLNENASVTISVFDLQGRNVFRQISNETAGNHSRSLPEKVFPIPGIYFIHFAVNGGIPRVMMVSKD